MNKSNKKYIPKVRDESIIKNHEKKERTPENTSISTTDPTKKTTKEIQKPKTASINWEEDKEVIKQYLNKEYPLTNAKIDKIIKNKKISILI